MMGPALGKMAREMCHGKVWSRCSTRLLVCAVLILSSILLQQRGFTDRNQNQSFSSDRVGPSVARRLSRAAGNGALTGWSDDEGHHAVYHFRFEQIPDRSRAFTSNTWEALMRRAYQMHITGALADLDLDWRKKAAYGAGAGKPGRKTYLRHIFSEGW